METWRKDVFKAPDFGKAELEIIPPTKFFDQLSFIGDEVVGCFVLETSEGYVMLDCMNPDQRSIDIIEDGFKTLGFDINKLRAIIITHGHGDHYGRADYFKQKYGCELYLSEADDEYVKNMPDTFPWPPIDLGIDHHIEDGEVLKFGDTEILCAATPGHCVGCCSFIFKVTDEGVPHTAAMWGGSGILPDSDLEAYENSWNYFSNLAKEHHVDAEIASHQILDMGMARYELVRNIVEGVPNPFVIGEEGYRYYEKKFLHLVQAAKAKRAK